MADRVLKSIKFPDLPDRYVVPTDASQFTYEGECLDAVLEKKANIDGTYDEMSVGSAEQLLSSAFVEDTEPYKYRTTGGSADVGDREYVDAIVGGSVAWNQKVQNGNFASASGWAGRNGTVSVSGGIATFTATTTGVQSGLTGEASTGYAIPSHKYLFLAEVLTPSASVIEFSFAGGGTTASRASTKANEWDSIGAVWQTPSAEPNVYQILFYALAVTTVDAGQTIKYRNVMAFDLTQMFGSAVADAVYNMEQGNAGAGVKWFKSLFPNDYYAYNAGELISVQGLTSHDTVGFNQWDEVWEHGTFDTTTGENIETSQNQIRSKNYIPILADTVYYVNSPSYLWCIFFDENKNVVTADLPSNAVTGDGNSVGLGTQTFKTPSGSAYMRFYCQALYGDTYKNDICINLSWSGWRNGEYEPYQKHSYALDSSLTLRGIPKLANGKMYFDGDEYKYDGAVTRNIGSVDLGNMTYFKGGDDHTFYATIDGMEAGTKSIFALGYSAVPTASWAFYTAVGDKKMASSGTVLYVSDASCSTVEEIKSATSGVILLFKLATPTTETAEPYQQIQICDDFGTEAYTSTSIVPIGHETRYPANLRDKLQHLPDLADTDGYYVIQQANKQMYLVHFRIPQAPTENGTYVLKATVSGGTPTYTWVEEN